MKVTIDTDTFSEVWGLENFLEVYHNPDYYNLFQWKITLQPEGTVCKCEHDFDTFEEALYDAISFLLKQIN